MRAVMPPKEEKTDPAETTTILAIILAIAVILSLILGVWACKIVRDESKAEDESAIKEGGAST